MPPANRSRSVGADPAAPLFTLMAYDRETGMTSLCRLWKASTARACQLCPRSECTAQNIPALGLALCFVPHRGLIDRESAPLFRKRSILGEASAVRLAGNTVDPVDHKRS